MTAELDWEPIRALGQRVIERGEPLELSDEVRSLFDDPLEEVAISPEDAASALRSVPTAITLLQRDQAPHSGGLATALDRLKPARIDLRDAGDLDGACRQMEKVLAIEAVPHYRRIAGSHLREATRLKSVAASGQVDPKLSDRAQVPSFCIASSKGSRWNSPRGCAPSCDGPPLTWA